MTVHQLMNAANVTPDVIVSIMQMGTELYFGEYEHTSEITRSLEVSSFRVTHLRQLEYRTDIDRMVIYIY